MKRVFLSFLRRWSSAAKSCGTQPVMHRQASYDALDNVALYLSPYDKKIKQVNAAYGFFKGLVHKGEDNGVSEKLKRVSILYPEDLSQRIPDIIGELTESVLQAPQQTINWTQLSEQICTQLYAAFYGIALTTEAAQACKTVFAWLFDASQMDFKQLPEQQQTDIAASLAILRNLIAQSIADTNIPTDLASATVVARSLALQREFALSDDGVLDLLTGVLVGTYPVVAECFNAVIQPLTTHRTFQSHVYQAATVGDASRIAALVGQLEVIKDAGMTRCIARIAAEDHSVETECHSRLALKKNDVINFWLDAKKIERDGLPRRIAFDSENPAGTFLLFGAEPHLGFGKSLAVTVLSVVLARLFSTYRIRGYSNNVLQLAPLPLDAKAYQFSILGSSPPWTIGEEQAWLLDASGFTRHVQHNILSIKEVVYLLFLQRRWFYTPDLFYCCYDKQHHIAIGSSFSGGGEGTLDMGALMHRFFTNTQRAAVKPAAQLSESEHFAAVFDAYTVIRNNYYSWAYFTAFLDKGYPFLYEALMLAQPKAGFKPLSIVGNGLLYMVLGLIRVLLALPMINVKFKKNLESTIETNLDAMGSAITTLDKVLSDGRPYILGDEFTAADIHVCANMGNLIVPDEYQGGGKLPPLERYPPTYQRNVAEFRSTLTGQYVMRVYRQHRVA